MAQKKKKNTVTRYRCMVGFTYWKGERILMGQEIEITPNDKKNAGLMAKLKSVFQPVASVIVESEPIKIINKE